MTKKFLPLMAALVCALIAAQPVTVSANEIAVTIDGQRVSFADQSPVTVDNRTLVPVRGVFEHLGFYVGWDGDAQQATLTREDFTVVITVGSAAFTTNGASHTLDVPAQIIENRTMLPIRAVLESVGYYVDWADNTVIVSGSPVPEQPAPEVTVAAPSGDLPAYIEIGGQAISTELTELLIEYVVYHEELALLKYMTNLTHLDIGGIGINDLTPIAGLTNLTVLVSFGNQISDLTPLSGLTNLTFLQLTRNRISDLTPLAGLTNLTELHLFNNQVSDLTPLSGLTNLRSLDVWSNQVGELTPLAGLTNLMSLNFWGNQINDLTPLAGLTNLMSLNLNSNQVSDLTPLVGLTSLEILSLNSNQISDISPLAELANLRILSLVDNPITDWSPIAHVRWVDGRPERYDFGADIPVCVQELCASATW